MSGSSKVTEVAFNTFVFGPFDLSVPRRAGQRGSGRTVYGGNYVSVHMNGQDLMLTPEEFAQYLKHGTDMEARNPQFSGT